MRVHLQVLNAISELAAAGGVDLVFSVETLFPSLVQFLQDSSSLSRREVLNFLTLLSSISAFSFLLLVLSLILFIGCFAYDGAALPKHCICY